MEGVEDEFARVAVRGGEVKIGREAASVACPELAKRCSTFEHNPEFEQTLALEVIQGVVLRHIEERRPGHATAAHVMAGKVSGGDHRSGNRAS